MTDARVEVTITVDGLPVTRRIEPRQHLVDFLREELQLTGAHVGCEHGVCGACTLRVEGEILRGCLMLAVQADGLRVDTIEGLSERGELADLQAAFLARNALQCGYCTPGMLGAKGAGEAGTGGAPAAIMNAINDALAPFRVTITTQPATPERLLRALGKLE
jgi:aerobic carbon-monoxide dehydrogenase small subunit